MSDIDVAMNYEFHRFDEIDLEGGIDPIDSDDENYEIDITPLIDSLDNKIEMGWLKIGLIGLGSVLLIAIIVSVIVYMRYTDVGRMKVDVEKLQKDYVYRYQLSQRYSINIDGYHLYDFVLGRTFHLHHDYFTRRLVLVEIITPHDRQHTPHWHSNSTLYGHDYQPCTGCMPRFVLTVYP